MNKEPSSFYVIRCLSGCLLVGFVGMLYWSSLLVEEDLQEIKGNLAGLKKEIQAIQEKTFDHPSSSVRFKESKSSTTESSPLAHADFSLPNLLEEDPFYAITLPKILGAGFKPQGTFQQAAIGHPVNLHPFSAWQNVSNWIDQCSVAVSSLQFGKYETFAPGMALRMEQRHRQEDGAVEYWVFLRDNVYWHPLTSEMFSESVNLAPHFLQKHQVTAHDFKFYLDAIMNPYVQEGSAAAIRPYFSDLEDVTVIDDLTFVVRWKTKEVLNADGHKSLRAKYISKSMTGGLRPLARFVYQYFSNGQKIVEDNNPSTYRTNSVWAQNFEQHWAKNIIPSCGAWVFEGMTEREIRFKRNPDYYSPLSVLVEESVDQFKETPDTVWLDFKANKLDFSILQPEQTAELSRFLKSEQYQKQEQEGNGIKQLEYTTRSYAYVGWNQARPLFQNKKIRQALTMAIDRERIIQQYLNGLGVPLTSPFYPYSPNYDSSLKPWPFDLARARQLLQEEGWYDSDNDGVIDKEINGVRTPFRFTLTYYTKNPTTKSIAEYISTTLKELGIQCRLNGIDLSDLSATFEEKNFDALMMGWALGTPPEDIRQIWSSSGAKEKGSSNAIGFVNHEVDDIIEKLDYTYNNEERIKLYHQFARIIYEECPYTFLYTPKSIMLYRNYLQNVWIPADRQDLVPGANIAEPERSIFWIKKHA